jgi:hypothetical protein
MLHHESRAPVRGPRHGVLGLQKSLDLSTLHGMEVVCWGGDGVIASHCHRWVPDRIYVSDEVAGLLVTNSSTGGYGLT